MAELSWPYSSPSDQTWYRDVASDCRKRPFRLGLRRGVLLRSKRLPSGLDGVLTAFDSMASMQATGSALLHRWVQARHEEGDSWGTIAQVLGVTRQTAYERFSRPAPYGAANAAKQLWVSVQVARDQAVSAAVGMGMEASWNGWRPRRPSGVHRYGRSVDGWPPPPRDQDDIAVLRRVLGCVDEEFAWLVGEARARGASWVLLSGAFGTTRQATHKRFHELAAVILAEASKAADRQREFALKHGFTRALDRPCLLLPEKGLCL
jgi:hypothetical protein